MIGLDQIEVGSLLGSKEVVNVAVRYWTHLAFFKDYKDDLRHRYLEKE